MNFSLTSILVIFLFFNLHLAIPCCLLHLPFQLQAVRIVPLNHMCHMLRPSLPFRIDHGNNIWRGVQIIEDLTISFSVPVLLPPSQIPIRLLQHPVLEYSQFKVHFQRKRPIFTPIYSKDKIMVLHILIFIVSDSKEIQNLMFVGPCIIVITEE